MAIAKQDSSPLRMTPWPSCLLDLGTNWVRGHQRNGATTSSFTSIRISDRSNLG
jgi:hypothetical protein